MCVTPLLSTSAYITLWSEGARAMREYVPPVVEAIAYVLYVEPWS